MEDLREVCLTVHHIRDLARHYGISITEMAAEMKRQGIIRHTRREDVDWGDLEAKYQEAGTMPALARMLGTTEKITYGELRRRGIQQRSPGHVKGQKKSDAWREASAVHWEDPGWRAEQRRKWLERLPTMRRGSGTSPLEQLLHDTLRNSRISFATHQPLLGRFIVDVLISQKPVVIEADGYSHRVRSALEKDALRDAALRQAGYEVFRVTYRELADDPAGCVSRLVSAAGLAPEDDPAFVISSDREAMSILMKELMREHWNDPERAAEHRRNMSAGQRRRRERERMADEVTVRPA